MILSLDLSRPGIAVSQTWLYLIFLHDPFSIQPKKNLHIFNFRIFLKNLLTVSHQTHTRFWKEYLSGRYRKVQVNDILSCSWKIFPDRWLDEFKYTYHCRKKYFKTWQRFFHNKRIYPVLLLITHTGIFPSFFTKTSVLTVTCSPENSISVIPVSLYDDHLGG